MSSAENLKNESFKDNQENDRVFFIYNLSFYIYIYIYIHIYIYIAFEGFQSLIQVVSPFELCPSL